MRLATTAGVDRVDELSDRLGVTASTIRRDLATLTTQGSLGPSPFHAWAVMPRRWTLVTDEPADPVAVRAVRDCGVMSS